MIFLYVYSRAFIHSLEYARDEQHRLTPRGSWYFFDLKFESLKGALIARLFLLVLFAQLGTSAIVRFDPLASFSTELTVMIFYMMLGFIGYASGFVTLIAPRFRYASLLALCGFTFGLLVWAGFLILVDFWIPALVLVGCVPGFGICFHFLAWHIAKSKTGEDWFRLNT